MDSEQVLDEIDYLRRIGQWPTTDRMNATHWIDAIEKRYHPHALSVLKAFIYFGEAQTKKLFTSAIHSLSAEVSVEAVDYTTKKKEWNRFLERAIFTAPTGETPNPTDSGYIFTRLARTELRVPERNIMEAQTAAKTINSVATPRPVVFVDDFAGSGNQFLETINRRIPSTQGNVSIRDALNTYPERIYYLPLVCTEYAVRKIQLELPNVLLRPAHILGDEYSAISDQTEVFPPELAASAKSFIHDTSSAAGLTSCIYGFHELCLSIAFEHSIPDACIALLWSAEGGWTPLMEKK